MKVSDYIVDYITSKEIKLGFFMIGGALGYLVDACARKRFKLYTMHHEQAAAFAAEGQAAVTKGLGLAMATSGPGATNLITGIGSAYFASYPVIFITGQVNTNELNIMGKGRQMGFQETDIVSLVKTITKYAVQIQDPNRIAYELEKAVFLSTHERQGPVLIDIPLNIQKVDIDIEDIPHFIGSEEYNSLKTKIHLDEKEINRFVTELAAAKRPVILAGHGVKLAGAEEKMLKLAEMAKIPVVTSLLGTDSIPHNHELFYGFIGTYGYRYANFALANSDFIIVLGSRLDSRQVGVKYQTFAPMAKIVHVDIDKSELNATVKEWMSINYDVADFLDAVTPSVTIAEERKEWIEYLNWLRKKYPHVEQKIGMDSVDPVEIIASISDLAKKETVAVADVGLNQMWFAQGWRVKKGQTILTNGGMGPMGYALPAAIGASVSDGMKEVWAITGDGGMQINIQELQTLKRHSIPVKIAVFNNQALGMVAQFQGENFEGRYLGTKEGYDAPDFVKIAEAYGLPARKIRSKKEATPAIKWLAEQKGPALLEILIPTDYLALPKAIYSKPIYDMRPFLERQEYYNALKYVDRKFLQNEKNK